MEDKVIILIGVIISLILVIILVYILVRRKTISDALKEEVRRDKKRNFRDQEIEEDEDEQRGDLKDISTILDNSNEIMKFEIAEDEKEESPNKGPKTITKTIIVKQPSNRLTESEAELIRLKIRKKHLMEEFKREEEKNKAETEKEKKQTETKKRQAETKIKSSLEKLRNLSKQEQSIIEVPTEPEKEARPDKKTQAIENLRKLHR